jgi:hypothetical protein
MRVDDEHLLLLHLTKQSIPISDVHEMPAAPERGEGRWRFTARLALEEQAQGRLDQLAHGAPPARRLLLELRVVFIWLTISVLCLYGERSDQARRSGNTAVRWLLVI